jgi:hypothetical protein
MRYRYRTAALLGPWQTSAEQACADAIRARQAYRDEDGLLIWLGNAGLEAGTIGQLARRLPN